MSINGKFLNDNTVKEGNIIIIGFISDISYVDIFSWIVFEVINTPGLGFV